MNAVDVESRTTRSVLTLHGTALAVYLVLAIAVTFPLVLHFTDYIPGDSQSDVWAHLWGYYRTERALIQDHELPANVDYINYPYGGTLYHIDLLNSLLMLPLKACFGMVIGFNLLVLGHLVFAAYAAFLLAHHLVRRPAPAILAGAVYAFSPYVTSMGLTSGVSERLNLAWIPLFLWLFFLALRTGKLRYSVLAGLMCLFTAMGCYKYGIFLAMFVLVLFIYLGAGPIWARLRQPPEEFAQRWSEYRRRILAMVTTSVLCVVSCVPLGLFAKWLTLDSSALFTRDATLFWDGSTPLQGHPPFRLQDFVLPTDSVHRVSGQYDVLYQDTYVGLSLLILGAFSVFSRRRFVRFFFPATVLFLLLSLGPEPTSSVAANQVVSLVYKGFARVVPFFTFLNNPWEMVLVVTCGLAVAVAGGLDLLEGHIHGKLRWLVLGAIVTVVVGDFFMLRPTPMPASIAPVEVSAFYRTLPEHDTEYGLFDLPPYRPCSRLRPEEYLFLQTVHGKPIPYAINDSWLESDPYWGGLIRSQQCAAPPFSAQDAATQRALDFLVEKQYRYLILHEDLLSPDTSSVLNATFSQRLGPPVFTDARLNVYNLWAGGH